MRKLFTIALFVAFFGAIQSTIAVNDVVNATEEVTASAKADTVYILEHPNAADSALVIKIVNGITSVAPILLPKQTALINQIKPVAGPFLVALILGLIRRRSIRKMKKKGLIPEDYKVPLV